MNIATDNQQGYDISGWRDEYMCSIRSAKDRFIMAIESSGKTLALTKEILARSWGCGLESVRSTLKVTTQFHIRNVTHPYDKWYKNTYDHMWFPTLASKYYSDTMFCKINSVRGNTAAQFFTDRKGDSHVYPLESKDLLGGPFYVLYP